MPFFSIITVCYNEVTHIQETLDSIVSQTFHNYELIVVDGGSTDGTKEIIERYSSQITWWCSEADKGTYNAMNKGVSHTKGQYVIFMNGGDKFYNDNVLENIVKANYTADIIEGYAIAKDTKELIHQHDDDLTHKLLVDGICHQSTLIRRELLAENPYDEKYKIVADWKFWILMLLRDRCTYQFLDMTVAVIDTTGITYSQFQQNLEERDNVLAELQSDTTIGYMAKVLRDYNYLTHNTLVQHAVYLDRHSKKGYNLVRKIAKRVVKVIKKLNQKKRPTHDYFYH